MNIFRNQTLRRSIVIFSALLFPVTMLYFSPGMVFRGARLGLLSGSYVVFGLLFLSALFFGRAWCGWLCPVAGFSEMAQLINNKPFRYNKLKIVKYCIWAVWIVAICLVVIFIGGGFHGVDLLMGTAHGISIHNTGMMLFYYLILGIVMGTSVLLGRRGFCHSLCWMAPFTALGRLIANKLNLPRLKLQAQKEKCLQCGDCELACPMSLPVQKMVNTQSMENIDCILCGVCVSACPHQVILIKRSSTG